MHNSNFTLKEYPFFFLVSDTKGSFIEDYTKYITFEAYKLNRTNSKTDYVDELKKVPTKCTMESFSNYVGKIDNDTLSTYVEMPTYCINWNHEDFIMNDYAYVNSSYINFAYRKCDVSKDNNICADDLDEILKEIYVRVYYMNSYQDSLDYKDPIKYYIDVLSQQVTSISLKRNYMKFVNSEFVADNGWLLEEKIYYKHISLDSIISEINNMSPRQPLDIYWLTIVSPQIRHYTIRKYMKIQDLFANIGGVINALFIICRIFFFNYLKYIYNLDIAEYLLRENNYTEKSGLSRFHQSNKLSYSYFNDNNINSDNNKNIYKESSSFPIKLSKENDDNIMISKFLNKDYLKSSESNIKEGNSSNSNNNDNKVIHSFNQTKKVSDFEEELKFPNNLENLRKKANNPNINNKNSINEPNNDIKEKEYEIMNNNMEADICVNKFTTYNNKSSNINALDVKASDIISKLREQKDICVNRKSMINFNANNNFLQLQESQKDLYKNIKEINYTKYLLSMTFCKLKSKAIIRQTFAFVEEKLDFFNNLKNFQNY